MLKSALFETLKLLNEEELLALDKFVHSRYFFHEDNASGVITLFETIYRYAPNFDSSDLERENLGKKIGQSSEYVLKLGSNLHSIVRKFIAFYYNEQQKDNFWQQLTLLRFYATKQNSEKFETLAERIFKELYQTKEKEDEYFLQKQLALNNIIFEFQIRSPTSLDPALRNTLHSLDVFYYYRKLRLVYYSLVTQQNETINQVDFNFLVNEVVLLAQNKQLLSSHEGIYLFYQAILLFSNHKKGNFEKFTDVLSQKGYLLSNDDQFLLNGLIRQVLIAKREIKFNSIIFNVYKHHLYKKYLYIDNKIPAANFRNVVRYGIYCKQLKWVEKFIKIHEHRVSVTFNPKEVVNLAYAYLFFSKREFSKAETYFSLDFEDAVHKVDARRIQVMMQYETKFLNIDSSIESFRKFVANSKKLPELHKNSNNNFVLYLRKIINPNLKRNDKKIDKLIENLKKEVVSEYFWLIEKLNLLKKRR